MRIDYLILIALFTLFLTACSDLLTRRSSKYPTSNFSEISDIAMLDGTYENNENKKSYKYYTHREYKGRLSNIFHLPSDSINVIRLKFNKDHMILSFDTDSIRQEKIYKGKFKNNSYFEATLSKERIPIPFLYFMWNTERVRIGRNEEKKLLIHYWTDNLGWVFFVATARDICDYEYIFKEIDP